MDNLTVEASKYTPHIFFDAAANHLEIKGESYPENTAEFFAPVIGWVHDYLDQVTDQLVTVDLEIIYFNSSSSKVLMDFFDYLEEKAEEGKNIEVNWIYDLENESAKEYGEEFEEDLETLHFNLKPKKAIDSWSTMLHALAKLIIEATWQLYKLAIP